MLRVLITATGQVNLINSTLPVFLPLKIPKQKYRKKSTVSRENILKYVVTLHPIKPQTDD